MLFGTRLGSADIYGTELEKLAGFSTNLAPISEVLQMSDGQSSGRPKKDC